MFKKLMSIFLLLVISLPTFHAQTISKEEFAKRRDLLIEKLDKNSIAVLPQRVKDSVMLDIKKDNFT